MLASSRSVGRRSQSSHSYHEIHGASADKLRRLFAQYSSTLNLFADAGDVDGAETVIQNVLQVAPAQKRRVVYNTMLKACANAADADRAEYWVRQMQENHIRLNERTFGKLIKIALRLGDPKLAVIFLEFERQSVEGALQNAWTYNTVLNLFAQGCRHDTERLWLFMDELGIEVNTFTYTTLMKASASGGDIARILCWWQRAETASNHEDVSRRHHMVLDALAQVADPGMAFDRLVLMRRVGATVNSAGWRAVLKAFSMVGDVDGVENFLHLVPSGQVDETFFRHILRVHATHGHVHRIPEILGQMTALGFVPQLPTYGAALLAFTMKGDVAGARGVLVRMLEASVQPDVAIFADLFEACAKISPRPLREAREFLESMVGNSIRPTQKLIRSLSDAVGPSVSDAWCREFGLYHSQIRLRGRFSDTRERFSRADH